MGKYKVLLDNGGAEEGTASHQELCELVASRVSILAFTRAAERNCLQSTSQTNDVELQHDAILVLKIRN